MNRLRLLWRLLTGADAATLHDHAARISMLERRTDRIERRQQAQEAFRQFGRDAQEAHR